MTEFSKAFPIFQLTERSQFLKRNKEVTRASGKAEKHESFKQVMF